MSVFYKNAIPIYTVETEKDPSFHITKILERLTEAKLHLETTYQKSIVISSFQLNNCLVNIQHRNKKK